MNPIRTTAVQYHVRLRADLPRDIAREYWANGHAGIVSKLPHVSEYRQHHFSETDHGYWPATSCVGVATGSDRLDGLAEMTFTGVVGGLRVAQHVREVFLDEQNVFAWDAGHLAGPYGGRRHSAEQADFGHRTTLLLRRRAGVGRRPFAGFVHETLAPALGEAGAGDIRSYVFRGRIPHPTPGVSHRYPPHERFHGAVHFGTATRDEIGGLLEHPAVARAVSLQEATCTAVHAYTTELLVPVIQTGAQP